MNRFRSWAAGIGLSVAGIMGYHHMMPTTHVIQTQIVGPPSPYVEPTPAPLTNQRINISCDGTCTDQEKADLVAIVQKLNDVEATDCFKNFLLDPKNGLDLNQTNGKTAQQVVDSVTTAKVSTQITYYEEKANWWTKMIVLGYEQPGDSRIHANRVAWQDMSLCEKVSNVSHELKHGPGMNYMHDFNMTARRPYSVPYMASTAALACCK